MNTSHAADRSSAAFASPTADGARLVSASPAATLTPVTITRIAIATSTLDPRVGHEFIAADAENARLTG